MTNYPFHNRGEPTVSTDKRTVATDALATLGTILGPNEKRDAIHIAVLSMTADHIHAPGAHVGIVAPGRFGASANPIGIVDPFLKTYVERGQKCWVMLYPGQVTSLRHVWTHPALGDDEVPKAADVDPNEDVQEQLTILRGENDRLERELAEAKSAAEDDDDCRSMGCYN